jgi:hypothetical protein
MNYFYIAESAVKGKKVDYADILYLKATSRYTHLITEMNTYVVYMPLDTLQKKLPRRFFRRVHTSYIVSVERIIGFDLELGFLSLQSSQYDPVGISIPVESHFNLNWYRKKCIPGKERKFASLLHDLLFKNNN